MGRIKTSMIKTMGNEILIKHKDKFTSDFEQNKVVLSKIKIVKSKKIRNVLAGYITKRLKEQGSGKL
ncbi:MAG: 30S ribosomal protein S17e [Candidatus Aenigmarchaeota archaeon]|nr:30S ribosomal protein S17e [Candidatus Aenigmarchaeota archaeon]